MKYFYVFPVEYVRPYAYSGNNFKIAVNCINPKTKIHSKIFEMKIFYMFFDKTNAYLLSATKSFVWRSFRLSYKLLNAPVTLTKTHTEKL